MPKVAKSLIIVTFVGVLGQSLSFRVNSMSRFVSLVCGLILTPNSSLGSGWLMSKTGQDWFAL